MRHFQAEAAEKQRWCRALLKAVKRLCGRFAKEDMRMKKFKKLVAAAPVNLVGWAREELKEFQITGGDSEDDI